MSTASLSQALLSLCNVSLLVTASTPISVSRDAPPKQQPPQREKRSAFTFKGRSAAPRLSFFREAMEHAEDNDYGVLSLASSSAFSDRAASISSTANVTPARLTATSTAGEAIEIDSAARQQQQSRMDGITSLVNSRYDGVDTHEHYSPEDSRHEYSHAMSRGQGSSDDSTLSGGGSFQPTSPSTARGGAAGGGGADSVLATPVLERAQLSLGPTAFYGDIQLGDQVSASLEHQWRDAVDRGRGTFEHHRQGSDGGASDGSPQRRQHDDLDVSHDGSQRHQRTSRGRALMLGSTASSYVFASAAQSVHQLAGQPAPEHAALRMSSPPASPTTSASDNMTGDESVRTPLSQLWRHRSADTSLAGRFLYRTLAQTASSSSATSTTLERDQRRTSAGSSPPPCPGRQRVVRAHDRHG